MHVDPEKPDVVDYIHLGPGVIPTEIVVNDACAYVAAGGSIYVIDIHPSSSTFHQVIRTMSIESAAGSVTSMAFNSDGKRLYVSTGPANPLGRNYQGPGNVHIFDTDPLDPASPDGKNKRFNDQIKTIELKIAPSALSATGDPNVMVFTGFPGSVGVLEAEKDDKQPGKESGWKVRYTADLHWSDPDIWFDLYYPEGITILPDASYAFVPMTGRTVVAWMPPIIIPQIRFVYDPFVTPFTGWMPAVVDVVVVDPNDYGPFGPVNPYGALIGIVRDPLGDTSQLVGVTRPIPSARGPDTAVVAGEYLYADYTFDGRSSSTASRTCSKV